MGHSILIFKSISYTLYGINAVVRSGSISGECSTFEKAMPSGAINFSCKECSSDKCNSGKCNLLSLITYNSIS